MNIDDETRRARQAEFRTRHGLQDLPFEDLDLAFTHRSHAFEAGNTPDNERLEFFGDAILSAVCSECLFLDYPDADEGRLSKMRSRLVSRVLLGRRAVEMGIGDLMLLGRGERQTGGRRRRSVLGSALEALIGAVHLKMGHEAAARFVREHVIAPLIDQVGDDRLHGDYKSALQEWSQRVHGVVPEYHRVADTGPDHAKAFVVEVRVAGRTLARGEGPRVKTAENQAARFALEAIQGEGSGVAGQGADQMPGSGTA